MELIENLLQLLVLYMYIKTVKQRTADFIKVIMYLLRSTGAFS